jgi:hypothetical protein
VKTSSSTTPTKWRVILMMRTRVLWFKQSSLIRKAGF